MTDVLADLRRRTAEARSELASLADAGYPYTDGVQLDGDLFEAAADEIARLRAVGRELLAAVGDASRGGWRNYGPDAVADTYVTRINAEHDLDVYAALHIDPVTLNPKDTP